MHGKCTFTSGRFFWQTDKNFLWLLYATATGWGTGAARFSLPLKMHRLSLFIFRFPVHGLFKKWVLPAPLGPASINEKKAGFIVNTGIYGIKVYLYKKRAFIKRPCLL
jgi:hypothetical protein